jgi:DNA-binding transcriptional MerR regulator
MPMSTLRVWERRYGLTQPELTPSGQRLYSVDDVRLLALIEQLTDLGHAIGSQTPLVDTSQLQRVASAHAQALSSTQSNERSDMVHAPSVRTWRLAVSDWRCVEPCDSPAVHPGCLAAGRPGAAARSAARVRW